MNKSLGEYIRLIPREDQDTMVGALLSKRPGLHRGMLAFVPIEGIKQALRPRHPDYGYAQQQQMAALQNQQWTTQWVNPATTTGTITSSGAISGIAGGGYGTSIGGAGYSPYAQEVPQTYLFAYAALLAAINAMPGALDEPEHYEEEQKLEACEA